MRAFRNVIYERGMKMKKSTTLWMITAIIFFALVSGCMSNRLMSVHNTGHGWFGYKRSDYPHSFSASNDASEDYDEFYKSNMEKLNQHSESGTLPEISYGEYDVCCADIADDKRPLKMIAYYNNSSTWRLIFYYTVVYGGKRVVCASDYRLKDEYKNNLRPFILKYLKNSDSSDCAGWRAWVAAKEYEDLTKEPPAVYLSQLKDFANCYYAENGFANMDQVLGRKLPQSKLPEIGCFDVMVEKGLLIRNGQPLSKPVISQVVYVMEDKIGRLRKFVDGDISSANSVLREINQELQKKRYAKKREIDEQRRAAEELARIERERQAFEKRVAEEKRKRKEAEELKRKREEDSAVIKKIESKINAWKEEHLSDIAVICSSSDPISALVSFAKENKSPLINVSDGALQLPENTLMIRDLVAKWKTLETLDWTDLASKSVQERVKLAPKLKGICDCLDENMWKAVQKYCIESQQRSADEALLLAIKHDDAVAITNAIRAYTAPLNRIFFVEGSNRWTPLTYSAMKGSCTAIKLLAAAGADVNYIDESTNTPIAQASWSGQVSAIQELIALDASIRNAPICAVRNGQLEAVKFFVEKAGVSVNALYDGEIMSDGFLFGEAVRNGKENICRYLVEQGCNVNYRPKSKDSKHGYYSAIEMAVLCKNMAMLSYLKSTGQVSEFYNAVDLAKQTGDTNVMAFMDEWVRDVDRNLNGLCGVKFGDIDKGGIPIAVGGDKGLHTRQFIPAKQFDEFDECYCLSTPKSHRVCKIYLVKSTVIGFGGSPDQVDKALKQKYLEIKPILERKYRPRCLSSYPWTIENTKTGKKDDVGIGFEFPNGVLDFSIADRKDLEDLYGGIAWVGRALLIVATDKNLYKLGKQEAEELNQEKAADSADAL